MKHKLFYYPNNLSLKVKQEFFDARKNEKDK